MKKWFLIENRNDTESKVILFGFNRHLVTPNFGSNIGVHIEVMKHFEPQPAIEEEYLETIRLSSENTFRIKTIQFDCKDESYVNEIDVHYHTGDANGIPSPYDKDYCFQTNKKHNTDIPIDGNAEISFYLNPKQIMHVLINE